MLLCVLVDDFLNAALDQLCQLSGLHAGIFTGCDGLQIVELYLYGFAALLVQDFKAIDEDQRNDGHFGLDSSPETAYVEFTHDIAVFAPGAFGENQEVTTLGNLPGHILNDSQGLPYILPIHSIGAGAVDNLELMWDRVEQVPPIWARRRAETGWGGQG